MPFKARGTQEKSIHDQVGTIPRDHPYWTASLAVASVGNDRVKARQTDLGQLGRIGSHAKGAEDGSQYYRSGYRHASSWGSYPSPHCLACRTDIASRRPRGSAASSLHTRQRQTTQGPISRGAHATCARDNSGPLEAAEPDAANASAEPASASPRPRQRRRQGSKMLRPPVNPDLVVRWN